MITNFKIFESVSVQPKIGDYVIVKKEPVDENKSDQYVIGKIKENDESSSFPYTLEFDDPDMIKYNGRNIEVYNISEFEFWSGNKEELEQILLNDKYNI